MALHTWEGHAVIRIVFGLPINAIIALLLQIIDCNSDGCLDIKDFSLGNVFVSAQGDPQVQKWKEIRDKFDFDGDGQVTMDEVSSVFDHPIGHQTSV